MKGCRYGHSIYDFFSHHFDVLLHTHKTTHQDVWAKVKRLFGYRMSFVLLGQQKDMGRMIYKQILTVGNHIIDIARARNIMHQQDPVAHVSRMEPHFECRCTINAENVIMSCMYETTDVCPECSRVREKCRGRIFSWGFVGDRTTHMKEASS